MANRRQRQAQQGTENAPAAATENERPESSAPPAKKGQNAGRFMLLIWGIPLILFIVIAILKSG